MMKKFLLCWITEVKDMAVGFLGAETQSQSRMTRFRSGTPYLVKSVSFEFATCPPLP